MKLSDRVAGITPSSTLAITAKAAELKEEGYDVIGLGAGEPDFNTPQPIIDAALLAAHEGQTKYTPTGGLLRLKKDIAAKCQHDLGLTYSSSEVIVCTGAKHALYLLLQSLLDPGDEVIIPSPYWVSYPEQVRLAGGQPVFIESREENDFKITAESLTAAITEKTKAMIINSPSNPTGTIYNADELRALGEICLEHDLIIISDEIYDHLIYGGAEHVSIAQLSPALKNQTILVNGVSKSYAMTGWRIGYAIGNPAVIKAMASLASHSTSNPATVSQFAAMEALEGSQKSVEEMRKAFEERLNASYEKLVRIPGITCIKPKGAFYLFPNVKEASEKAGYVRVSDWAKALLDDQKVALVPGAGFGAPDNVRLSYATSLEQLEKALDRIETFVKTK